MMNKIKIKGGKRIVGDVEEELPDVEVEWEESQAGISIVSKVENIIKAITSCSCGSHST